jgi:gamma-glutamyltranspeptidase/glutathione hydrolase/leukotriene-C4 hydrolase
LITLYLSQLGLRLVIGGSGGPKITTAVAFVAIRHLWMDEDIKVAIDAPRIHHQLFPDKIVYENNFPQNILNNLKEKGHQIEELPEGERGAVIMAISKNKGNIYANSDYRKGGTVDGI